jgi:arylsulfatase A-like enzyme
LTLLSPKRADFGTSFTRIIVPDGEEDTQADVLAINQAIALLQARVRTRSHGEKRMLRSDAPFFLAVGLVRPHVPSVAPRRLFDRYPPEKMALPDVPPGDLDDVPAPAAAMRNDLRYGMNETQQREAIAAYYATVEFMDEQVGRLLGELDRLGVRDRTLVIFTSDHGFHLGEHGLWQKTTLFEESLRVPLIVSAPGFASSAGKHCDALVELTDLYPTIADLAGVSDKAPRTLAGRSLRSLLAEPAAGAEFRDVAYSVTGNGGRSVRNSAWRYNSWGEGPEELYDLRRDPGQFTNLAGDPAYATELATMRTELERRRGNVEAGKPGAR